MFALLLACEEAARARALECGYQRLSTTPSSCGRIGEALQRMPAEQLAPAERGVQAGSSGPRCDLGAVLYRDSTEVVAGRD